MNATEDCCSGTWSGPSKECSVDRSTASALDIDHQSRATIQAPRVLFAVVIFWLRFAEAHQRQAVRGHPVPNEVLANRVGPTFSQRQVVFRRADVARVAFDPDLERGVLLQDLNRL